MALPSTFITIKTAVAAKLRLTEVTDDAKIGDWVNQAYADVCQETRCLQDTDDAPMTAGTSTYTLDAQILTIDLMFVVSGGIQSEPLVEVAPFEILQLRAGSSGASGPAQKYALVGLNQLEVWPTPSAADTLTFLFSHLPTYLSADGDLPVLPEPFASKLLEYGALVQGAEWKKDLLMLGEWQQAYQGWLASFQRFLNRKQGGYPRAFPVWDSAGFVPHDRSADTYGVAV